MSKHNALGVAWFVLGFGTFVFTRMSAIVPTIPIATLIAPVFILRFSRTQPARRGSLLTLLGFVLSINIDSGACSAWTTRRYHWSSTWSGARCWPAS
jgi:hypothetical protein